jgi:hypothetical protein
MYVIGMKTANSTKKTAVVVEAYLTSLKAPKSIVVPAFELPGNLVLRSKQAIAQISAERKAIMPIAHGNPILGAAKRMIKGKITPPIPPAVHAMPVA